MYEKRYSNMADSERMKLESDVEDSYDIYPHPTVRVVRPNVRVVGHSSWKEALTEVSRRKAFLGFLAVLVFILLLTIVIVLMVQGRADPPEENNEPPNEYGLFSYPYLKGDEIIRFKQDDYNSRRKWVDLLDEALNPYSPNSLTPARYTFCDITERHGDKQCIFHIADLGDACHHKHEFGYAAGTPCILLQLKLPFHPKLVEKNSTAWNQMHAALGSNWNPSYISVTCDGKTQKDKDDLNLAKNMTIMKYAPSYGFPAAFFPSDLNDYAYLAPLVMVQIRLLKIDRPVTVECIAWAQTELGTLPDKSELYKTEFKLMLE